MFHESLPAFIRRDLKTMFRYAVMAVGFGSCNNGLKKPQHLFLETVFSIFTPAFYFQRIALLIQSPVQYQHLIAFMSNTHMLVFCHCALYAGAKNYKNQSIQQAQRVFL